MCVAPRKSMVLESACKPRTAVLLSSVAKRKDASSLPSSMFDSARRLRLKREFEAVFAARRSVTGKFARLAYLKTQAPLTRFGIVTSAKVSKKAVIRNRLRRRLRMIFKDISADSGGGYDIVCMCLPAAAASTFQELRDDVTASWGAFIKRSL